jgi:hypothetical protein
VGSGYRVFDVEELLGFLPASLGVKKEEIKFCVKTLAEREYVSVKYIDDNEVCLCPLPKGRLVFENRIDLQIEQSRVDKKVFAHAFLGALIGAILPTVIFLAFFLFGGLNA